MDETALKRMREVVFGVQDGLISNVALATSMAVATEDIKAILIAGLTGAIAGTFSMASGAFLASRAEIEVEQLLSHGAASDVQKNEKQIRGPLLDAIAMGVSFLIAASIPIIPYFILEGTKSIAASILATLLSLFVLGLVKGIFVKKALFKSGAEVFLIGFISASVGYGLGEFIPLVLATLL